MSRVTVKLDPEIEQHIDGAIGRGEASSRDRYVAQALRDRYVRELRRQKLDAALDRGIADAGAGRVKPLDEAFAEISSRLGSASQARTKRKLETGSGS